MSGVGTEQVGAPLAPLPVEEGQPSVARRGGVGMVSPRPLAARPKTLPAAVAPVIGGTALAAADGRFALGAAAACFAVALLLQIAANFANDVFDYRRGADTSERLGPTRVTQSGLIAPGQVLLAT